MTTASIHTLPLDTPHGRDARLPHDLLLLACSSEDADRDLLMQLTRELRRTAGPIGDASEEREMMAFSVSVGGHVAWLERAPEEHVEPHSILELHDGEAWVTLLVFELLPLEGEAGAMQRAPALNPAVFLGAAQRVRHAIERLAERRWVPGSMWDLEPRIILLRAGTPLRWPAASAA